LLKLPQVSSGGDSCEELKGHSGRFVLLLAKKKKRKKLARRCVSLEFLIRMALPTEKETLFQKTMLKRNRKKNRN
jgi:hypothetical protein